MLETDVICRISDMRNAEAVGSP